MAERMVRQSLRDIGRGMQDAMEKIGRTDPDLVYAFGRWDEERSLLEHSQQHLRGIDGAIEPYKEAVGVIHDFSPTCSARRSPGLSRDAEACAGCLR